MNPNKRFFPPYDPLINGAEVNHGDNVNIPLHVAASYGRLHIVEFLLDHGELYNCSSNYLGHIWPTHAIILVDI